MTPYDVLYIDPPWPYRNVKTGGSHTSGAAQKYPTMTLDELAMMPLDDLAARDSVCFLWATTPLGADPFDLLSICWPFKYKTKWYWHKVGRKGMGYWTRGAVEEVLIGVRGHVSAWRSTLSNWIEAPGDDWLEILDDIPPFESVPSGHSRKPTRVREMIEILTPGARRVELFATEYAVGWDSYGLALDPAHDFRTPEFWEGILGYDPTVSDIVRRQGRREARRARHDQGGPLPAGD
jgi:N6-adenosine-specific RNA methylase IME4